jgi:hypothetical protein
MAVVRRPGVVLYATSYFTSVNPNSVINDSEKFTGEINLRGEHVGNIGADLELEYLADNAVVTDNIIAKLYSRKGSDNFTGKENAIVEIPITNYGSAKGICVESLRINGFDHGFGRYRYGIVTDPGGTDTFHIRLRVFSWT